MKLAFAIIACCCVSSTAVLGQQTATRPGSVYFNINMSDYSFAKAIRSSSLGKTVNQKEWLKPGGKSFGLGVGYWRALGSHIDVSGTLTGTLSSFPAGFIKNDTVGQAAFTTQMDALLHLRLLNDGTVVNPFLTAGGGAGFFNKQAAVYAPLGAGLQFNFGGGGVMLLQVQWRKKLSSGISNDYTMYSLGFTQKSISSKEKKINPQPAVVVPLPVKRNYADTDKDGLTDDKDDCPFAKGSINGCPDSDNDGVADKYDKCPYTAGVVSNNGCPAVTEIPKETVVPDTTDYIVYFEPGKSVLRSDAYNILTNVVGQLKTDPKLRVSFKGHTDNAGSVDANYKISLERANACAAYIQSFFIDKSRVSTAAFGKDKPAADLNDPLLQWKNRRVEITVYKVKDR